MSHRRYLKPRFDSCRILSKMEKQVVTSRKVEQKEKKKDEYLPRKQVSDESEQLEKSCLTEEEDACLSDASQNSKKSIREDTTCESKKTKRHKPNKDSRYKMLSDDDWLFGNNQQKNVTNNKVAIKVDDDRIMKLLQRSSGDSFFPRAQLLSQVGIFALPYTVPF